MAPYWDTSDKWREQDRESKDLEENVTELLDEPDNKESQWEAWEYFNTPESYDGRHLDLGVEEDLPTYQWEEKKGCIYWSPYPGGNETDKQEQDALQDADWKRKSIPPVLEEGIRINWRILFKLTLLESLIEQSCSD